MSFWESELGEISGNAEDAFAKTFKQIPDGTTAIAKIDSFKNEEFNDYHYLSIEWQLIDGEFKGQKVNQKIKVFDSEPKVKHRSLNMLKLIYQLFKVQPKHNNPPEDKDLAVFVNKQAGIKIRETEPNEKGKQYNWVSEIHPAQGFKAETGIKLEVVHKNNHLESALTRNQSMDESYTDDIPF